MLCVQVQNFLCSFCGGEERAHPGLQRRQQRASGAAEGQNPPLPPAGGAQMSQVTSACDSPPPFPGLGQSEEDHGGDPVRGWRRTRVDG